MIRLSKTSGVIIAVPEKVATRQYTSSLGRWMTPDAINITDERVINPANTLNKYRLRAAARWN
jgi:hypothetical protein